MPSKRLVFSAESVTCGQPNKLCDLIVDTILDGVLRKDRFARADLQAVAAPGLVLVSGELTTNTYIDITGTVRQVLTDAGYDNPEIAFNARSIAVLNLLQEQSEEVGLAVDKRGASDQGIAIGYATNEAARLGFDTNLSPVPIWTAHQLARKLNEVLVEKKIPGLFSDGQVQVTFMYEDNLPVRLLNATVSTWHSKSVDHKAISTAVKQKVLRPVIRKLGGIDTKKAVLHVNHTGPFTSGGPTANVGMSGRTTVMDLYGTAVPTGGKSLSGKDPTKTDRAATYMARHVAKCVVAAGLAARCEVRLAYLFGRERPVSLQVNTFATGVCGTDRDLADTIRKVFDLSTPGIVEHLDLRRVRYAPICCFGHIGRPGVPWEDTASAEPLAAACAPKKKGKKK
ncbi:MAG: methionine adenosyltransferase [Candidatus Lernaella stagnicola]|nr:methionine adenosyltransferase [Candidatus Lernaella stagnicola]